MLIRAPKRLLGHAHLHLLRQIKEVLGHAKDLIVAELIGFLRAKLTSFRALKS
jgi:hypothetical protein